MLDIALIASTAVGQILLPYIKDGAVKFVETIAKDKGEAIGEYAGNLASTVWDKVKSIFSSEKDQAVLEQFQEEPEAAGPLLEAKLKKKLEEDPEIAETFDQLIQSTAPDGSTGLQIIGSSYVGVVHVAGNISGGTVTGGTFNFGGVPAPPASVKAPPRSAVPQPTSKDDPTNK
ncbi:MAG: hypothetical protein AABM67_17480 [Acidobacteriota bacterium]